MVFIDKTIEVAADVRAVYEAWTAFEDFPKFMETIATVTHLQDDRLHWVALVEDHTYEWDADLVEHVTDEKVRWRAVDGRETGEVRFEKLAAARTKVTYQLEYDPPAWEGNDADTVLQWMNRRVDRDLNRFKKMVEALTERGLESSLDADGGQRPSGSPPGSQPALPPNLTSWRVSAGVQARRTLQDIAALSKPDSVRAQEATTCVEEAIAIIADSQGYGWWTKLMRIIDGSDVEHAWQLLKQAEENLALAKDPAELTSDVPWLCDVARLSYPTSRASDLCATLKTWLPSNGKPAAGKPDGELAAAILAADHAQSNAAHQQTRSLRNLLYIVTVVVIVLDVIVWHLRLGSLTVIVLGALGGGLAMVFAISKGSPVTPYNLAIPQLLLKVVSGSAVAIAALLILRASFQAGLTDPEKDMYALVFGFSQQLFTYLVDNRAATLKDALAPKATKTMESG